MAWRLEDVQIFQCANCGGDKQDPHVFRQKRGAFDGSDAPSERRTAAKSAQDRLITLAGIIMGSSVAMPSPAMQIRNRIPNSKIRFKIVYLHLKKQRLV